MWFWIPDHYDPHDETLHTGWFQAAKKFRFHQKKVIRKKISSKNISKTFSFSFNFAKNLDITKVCFDCTFNVNYVII